MSTDDRGSMKKRAAEGGIFLLIMVLTFYAVFHGQDWYEIGVSLKQLSSPYLFLAVLLALFFVSAEGIMIWYLLRTMHCRRSGILRCISYSFIGFFYSGITPSATGGQPVQLYYMKKDGNSLSDSSVVLMTVAVIYKFVLAVMGSFLLIFWIVPLKSYLGKFFPLYLLGLALNVILVVVLLAIMMMPDKMKNAIEGTQRLLIRIRVLKPSVKRKEKIGRFVEGYRDAVHFLGEKKGRIVLVIAGTFIQRISIFVLTALIYLGFSQQGTGILTVIILQASVYIAVDMLPLPGAQGITELMYCVVFRGVFGVAYLMPSLYVTRGINFYFLLIVSLIVVAVNEVYRRIRRV